MKKDIMVIRASIGRIVSMLTRQAITVTQRGTGAYVKYNPKTGAIIELNVPYIPDDASDEFIAAIQGFLDHEVGHVLYSDSAALKLSVAAGKRVANLANIIEDVFVERKMTEGFQGSGHNLESVRKFYLEKVARPKIDASLAAGNTEEARGYAMVAAFRAWGGQTSAIDFIKHPAIAALVEPVATKLGADILAQLPRCNSSMDCLALARLCKTRMEEPKEKPPAPPPPDANGEGGDADGGDKGDKGDTADSKASGTPDTKEDAPGKDEAPEGAEEVKPKDDEPEEVMPSDTKDADDTGDTEDTGHTDDMPDEPAEDEGSTEVKDDDSGKTGSEDSDALADSEDTKAGDKSDGEEGEPDKESGVGTGGEGDSEDEGSDAKDDLESEAKAPDEPDPLAELFDTEHDFDKDMAERLSDMAKGELETSKYGIFSTDWDKIEPAPLADDPKSAERMEAQIRDKIGVMQKQLERAISAQARRSWSAGKPRGRISPGSLFKTAVGDDRVFRQRFETKAKNTAISLVVDCSGSMMHDGRIDTAGLAAYALAAVLERLKVKYEVIGFSTGKSAEMTRLMGEDAKARGVDIHDMKWARIEPLYLPVFKPFSGRLDTEAVSRLAHLTEGPGWLRNNVDGESVQVAAHRLKAQSAQRHVMIVLSDGEPACSSGRGQKEHLKKTVQLLEKQGVEIIGVGIQTRAVEMFYSKSVVLNDVEELPARVLGEISKLLLA